jgi:hypothetical protein
VISYDLRFTIHALQLQERDIPSDRETLVAWLLVGGVSRSITTPLHDCITAPDHGDKSALLVESGEDDDMFKSCPSESTESL